MRSSHPGCRRYAFSLIELMMVIAIIATLSGMAVPRFTRAGVRYRLDTAAWRVAADWALAQARARQTSASQSVVMALDKGGYQLTGEPDQAHPGQVYTVSLGQTPYEVALSNVTFTSATLTFNGFGVPSEAGSVTLSAGGLQRRVLVAADSGTITIQ